MLAFKSLNAAAVAAGTSSDPYFDQTVLLLDGDGTNGAQNNTFVDASANNFSITRVGNTTQGSFNPYGTLWSNYFDGNGDYLDVPSNAQFDFGTGDFTIELFVYPEWFSSSGTSSKSSCLVFGSGGSADGGGTTRYSLEVTWQGYLAFYNAPEGGANTFTVTATSNALNLFAWNHVAVVRNGTSVSLFVNGVQCTTSGGTIGASVTVNRTSVLRIGRLFTSSTFDFQTKGNISNLRIVKGTAVYTSGFTPPTAPLTTITNTSLLTCQSNRLIDNSANNFTITKVGDVVVTNFAPFNPTSEYASSSGASGYFDGAGTTTTLDNVYTPESSALDLIDGSNTVECWIYPTGRSSGGLPLGGATIFGLRASSLSGGAKYYALAISGTGYLSITKDNNGSADNASTTLIPLNAWTHIAWVRTGGANKFYVNGVDVTATFSNPNLSGWPLPTANYACYVGVVPYVYSSYTYLYPFNGYISNFRVVKGTAVYTSNFTPPTAPVTAITNTSLLLNFANAGIVDYTTTNDIETVGNAQVSTAQKKFGIGSIYFDGTDDYLTTSASTTNLYVFGTGDFTIETWVYFSDVSASRNIYESRATTEANRPVIYIASGTIRFYNGSADVITSGSVSTGTWYHLVVCRASGTTRMFLNGTQTGSSYTDSTNYGIGAGRPLIGAYNSTAGFFSGYLDDFRVTKGVARYTANFTPPAAPFPKK